MRQTLFIKKNLIFVLFLVSLFTSYLIGLTHYDITNGLDWYKYEKYIKYFLTGENQINDSQGIFYFYVVSLVLNFQNYLIGPHNFAEITNNGVQLANFLFYCIALTGLYKLMKSEGLSKKNILLTFILLNFFPPSYYLRLTMKPEILAFSLLPWVIYLLKMIIYKQEVVNYYIPAFLISLLFSSKGSIAGITFVVLIIFFNKSLVELKNHKVLIFLTFLFSLLFNIEAYNLTNKFIFENQVSENYLTKPSLSFFYTINLPLLITDPYKYLHSNSLISIILLDTFNDYFDFFWSNDESIFVLNQLNISKNFFVRNYLREYIGISLTALFYLKLLMGIFKNKDFKYYYIFPFVGLIILILNSIGFPSMNFDINTADTFKTHYYAFLICIAFTFLAASFHTKIKTLIYPLLLISFLFFIGFPKSYDSTIKNQVTNKFNHSEICNIFLDSDENCRNLKLITCTYDPALFNLDFDVESRYLSDKTLYFIPLTLYKDSKSVNVRNRSECLDYFNLGYRYQSPLKTNLNVKDMPIFTFLVTLLVLIISIKQKIKKIF